MAQIISSLTLSMAFLEVDITEFHYMMLSGAPTNLFEMAEYDQFSVAEISMSVFKPASMMESTWFAASCSAEMSCQRR